MRFLNVGLSIVMLLAALQFSASAQESPLSVIATTSILADVASRVAGDAAHVESLFPLGANAHTAEPSAQDVARLSDADLVLTVGANYEEGLLPVLEEAGGENVITVSLCVPIRPVGLQEEHIEEIHIDDHDDATAAQCSTHYKAVNATFGLTETSMQGALGPLYMLTCGEHHDDEEEHEHEPGDSAGKVGVRWTCDLGLLGDYRYLPASSRR